MNNDLVDILLLSLVSMFNPTLLAAVTVMMLLPSPKRLMASYLLGAYTTSITLGLVIVFALPGSSTESTSKHTIGPLEDIAVGLLAVAIAFVLRTGRDQPFQERRREKKEAKLKAKEEAADRVVAAADAGQRRSQGDVRRRRVEVGDAGEAQDGPASTSSTPEPSRPLSWSSSSA